MKKIAIVVLNAAKDEVNLTISNKTFENNN